MSELQLVKLEILIESLSDTEKDVIKQIIVEYQRSKVKHPKWKDNYVIAAAVVSEESGELMRAALEYEDEGGEHIEMIKEAIQVGAMGLIFVVDSVNVDEAKIKLTPVLEVKECGWGLSKLQKYSTDCGNEIGMLRLSKFCPFCGNYVKTYIKEI